MTDYIGLLVQLRPILVLLLVAIVINWLIAYLKNRKNTNAKSSKQKSKDELRWSLDLLMSLEWKRYEEICRELLQIEVKGRLNVNVTQIGADGGIDLTVTDSKGKLLAIGQCKAWSNIVGVSLIRELYGVMASEKVEQGYFFATSSFSHDATEFTKGKKINLVDGAQQIKMILSLSRQQQIRLMKVATAGDYQTPTCPRCDKKMIRRNSNKGEFWGCLNYPRCKATLNVRIK
jgi:restriction system protein